MSYPYYIIGDDHQPQRVGRDEFLGWELARRKVEHDPKRVAFTKVGETDISTVFLSIDHQFGDGPPILFETLVFGGDLDGEMDRYSTWEAAERGHAVMVRRVTEGDPE